VGPKTTPVANGECFRDHPGYLAGALEMSEGGVTYIAFIANQPKGLGIAAFRNCAPPRQRLVIRSSNRPDAAGLLKIIMKVIGRAFRVTGMKVQYALCARVFTRAASHCQNGVALIHKWTFHGDLPVLEGHSP
jgi:hypothetical protein